MTLLDSRKIAFAALFVASALVAPVNVEACRECDWKSATCVSVEVGWNKCAAAGEHCLQFGGNCKEPNSYDPTSLPASTSAESELDLWLKRIEVSEADLFRPFAEKASAQRAEWSALKSKLGREPKLVELPVTPLDHFLSPEDSRSYGKLFFQRIFPVLESQCFPRLLRAGHKALHYVIIYEVRVSQKEYTVTSAKMVASNLAAPGLAECVEKAHAGFKFPKSSPDKQPALMRVGDQSRLGLRAAP